MNEEPNQQPDLWTLAGQISTTAEGDAFFARLVRETKNYADPGVRSLLQTGLRTLMENSRTDADRASEIIEKHILPLCLQQDSVLPPELLSDRDARAILSEWVEQYPDESRIPLRAFLLERTVEVVKQSSSVASIKTLAAFGLRSPWIERTLVRFIRRRGPVGDEAINALCSLSPTGALRSRLIRAVIQRKPFGRGKNLNYAIQELASPQFIPMLRDHLRGGNADLWTTPFLLGRISDRVPGDGRVQSRVWRVFEEILQNDTESAQRLVAIGNTLANCNAPEVVRCLLANIGKPGFNPHRASNHLKSCYRPEQLSGWITDRTDLKARLTDVATLPGSQTRSLTVQDIVRQAAWETAFCAGIVDVSNWLSSADINSPLGVAETLTYASFSPPPDWPPFVSRLITEQVDIGTGGDLWYSARIAATKMVAATESPRALDLLLSCGLTGGGAPLLSTTTSAADLAERLSLQSPGELLAYLFGVCEDRARAHARMSAIAGLQRLAGLNLMSPGHLDRLLSLAADDSLPDYAIAAVIWIIGTFEGVQVSDALRARLVKNLEVADVSEQVKFQSLQALIHLGIWSDYGQIVSRVLNLIQPGSSIDATLLKGYRGWQAYALGLLMARAPGSYQLAAKQLLENGGGEAVHLLLQALGRSSGLRQDVAVELGRAAIERSVRVLGLSFGETDNFEIIARLAPREFLRARWEDRWGDWMPHVRCALADSLQKVSSPDDSDRDRIFELLRGLLGDSAYMVRRSASRTYSRIDSAKLHELCSKWMRSGQTELRIRSAESAQWLPVDNGKSSDNAVVRNLLEDPEPSVRVAAKRSASELRAREWRAFALAKITSGDQGKMESISTVYRYGRALASLGDDETIAAIKEMRSGRSIPVNMKNWLAKLAEDISQHWKEVTQRWSDALPAWSGQIEELETRFSVDNRHFTTRISLWQRRQEEPADLISWGGGFPVPSLSERMRMILAPKREPLILGIEGRQPARIWCSSVSPDGQVLFIGTGPYPNLIAR